MFFTSLFSYALLASSALAAGIPTREERHAARIARRAALGHRSQPVRLVGSTTAAAKLAADANTTATQAYSTNWAGAALKGFASIPAGGSSTETYYASAWVGIDGYSCGTAIDAWYEWWPDYAYEFTQGITIKAGDKLELTVTATSTKTGSATVRNLTTGKSATQQITSTAALCEADAEWIIEDFTSEGGLVPFANFGQVTIAGAVAGRLNAGNIGPQNATIIDIKQNDKVLTKTTVGQSSVTVKYIG